MLRKTLVAFAIAAAAFAGPGRAGAETLRLENVNGMQEVVGGAPSAPRSGVALRLENANGMQEVVYDAAAPSRPAATGGTPRLVNEGGGDHSVAYGR